MADYSPQVDQLNDAANICWIHAIKSGAGETYPRWPEAWAACEVVWRNYLDMQTMGGSDDEKDRRTVILEGEAAEMSTQDQQQAIIIRAAQEAGIDPSVALAIAERESNFNPNEGGKGSIRGMYQMTGKLRQEYGIGNSKDPETQARGWAIFFKDNKDEMAGVLGRDPTDAEGYLGHHFGATKAARMMRMDPNTPVDQVFTPYEMQGNPHIPRAGTVGNLNASVLADINQRQTKFSGGAEPTDLAQFGTLADQQPSNGTAKINMGASDSPKAFIVHHTGGRGDPANVVADWRANRPGVGAQYIMDRDGVIHDTRAEYGYGGHAHMITGSGAGAGLNSGNTVGMEVVAKDNNDVTPAQIAAGHAFIQKNYPNTPVFGHGEVNPGHREADEGMGIVNSVRGERAAPDLAEFGRPVDDSGPDYQGNFDRNKKWSKSGNYRTDLGDKEAEFQKWVQDNKIPFDVKKTGPDDYDMRGFWKGAQEGDPRANTSPNPNDGQIHYDDKWKTPYHKSFSNESQWAKPNAPTWNDKDQLIDPSTGGVVYDEKAPAPVPQPQSKGLPDLSQFGTLASEGPEPQPQPQPQQSAPVAQSAPDLANLGTPAA